ncbi:likely N2,N2-dimethylguanosine-specific tRNA methyltransferase [Pseudozyma hubeiensis SY62]|uniref:tRNA (guanine(26)-N(2))-dimethyltransferase n=1 Tax=Pseudozyma hubeiensis (strain SY62) TaxID=1305764 RepID=R9PP75_PSEHS|nr:likely N2,N2-dimethylguanosine-specific tRNA methyltransferase [Pseudozyma hubeiensis SY62]GAC99900.1 likely N2,N2-dimethylguanosine-specific tRNA methyltransferase [Pseudozyma hubeiensis SY62]
MAPTPILLAPERARASGITLADHESAFRENSATIVMPSAEAAFLNPVQEFNRDLSTLAIRTWSERLDAEKKARFVRAAQRKAATASSSKGKAKRKGVQAANGSTSTEGAIAAQEESQDAKRARVDANGNGVSTSSVAEDSLPDEAPEASSSTLTASPESEYRNYKFTLLEALSATGLRSIRYAKEIPLLRWVLANDLSPTAVEMMKRNVALNFPPDRPVDEWIVSEANETGSTDNSTKESECDEEMDEDALAERENEARANASAKSAEVVQQSQATEAAPEVAETATASIASVKAKDSTQSQTSSAAIHPDCKVKLNAGDAITLMYTHREPNKRFDVVDLDPYGSAAPFIDGGVQSVADGGLLCVTCTDLAVLAGHNYPEKCFSQYGGVSVKAEFSHEVALRLVLHTIATSAARYGRYIQPMLSLSIDFYLRTFVRVWTGPVEVKNVASKTGTVYICTHCQDFHVQRFGRATQTTNTGKNGQTNVNYRFNSAQGPPVGERCNECGNRMHLGGPMWLGELHDSDFCQSILTNLDANPSAFHTTPRIRGMVSLAAQELSSPDSLFYFTPPKASGLFHCVSPPLDKMVSALLSAGHKVSRSHAAAGSLKTDASRSQVFDILRYWVKTQHPVKMENMKPNDPARILLAKEAKGEYDFENTKSKEVLEALGASEKLVRYQNNPLPNWGPGTAAKGHKGKKKRNLRPDDLEGSNV